MTFTATVSPQGSSSNSPTGTVQFQVDGSAAGSAVSITSSGSVATASFSTSTLAVGTHTVTATYNGDGNFAGSTGTLTGGQVVQAASTISDGTILVATSPLSGQSTPRGIIGVNPSTGAQSSISTGGLFSVPEYVREAANQMLYVADYSASTTGAIIGVNPSNGQQSVVATGGNINGPVALAIKLKRGGLAILLIVLFGGAAAIAPSFPPRCRLGTTSGCPSSWRSCKSWTSTSI